MNACLLATLIALTNGFGRVSVETVGAHVLSYVPTGGEEVLFCQSGAQPSDRRQWYHGGIPICWPWFGRYGDPGSCMHGLARQLEWTVVARQETAGESRLCLRLRSDEESARQFDGSFELDYEIVLGESLRLNLLMRNTGSGRFAVTAGFHPYFRLHSLSGATVETPMEAIRCVPGMDGGRPYAAGRYVLRADGREISLTTWGNRKLVIWNPGEAGSEGLGPEEWRSFVCVEPAVLPRMEGLWLDPQATYEIGMEIRSSSCGLVRSR